MSSTLTSADCDYYAGTSHPDLLNEHELTKRLRAHEVKWVPGVSGYRDGQSFIRHDRQIARLFTSPTRPPYVIASGIDGAVLMEALRGWPHLEHRVSRMDAKVDLIPENGILGVLADLNRLVPKHVYREERRSKKPGEDRPGITGYFGSPSSEVRLRAYDKHAESPEGYVPGTVRIEVQMRPQKERKTWASTAPPEALFGCVKWLQPVADYVEVAGERAPRAPVPKSDMDTKMENLVRQYGNVILERLDFYGGDFAALGEELVDRALNGGKLPTTALDSRDG